MIDDSVTLPSRRGIELMRLSATAVTAGYVLLAYLAPAMPAACTCTRPGSAQCNTPPRCQPDSPSLPHWSRHWPAGAWSKRSNGGPPTRDAPG